MPKTFALLLGLTLTGAAALAQSTSCVTPTNQQVIIYRAGSLTRAFAPLIKTFTCQTGIQVKDFAMGSLDAARQITAGAKACDIFAPADDLDIDLLLKPAGYADYNIVFAQGRMVLAYSASSLAARKLPPIAQPGEFNPPNAIPKAVANWYEILNSPGVTIGAGYPFLDPSAYRAPMIFQLAEAFYKVPALYNSLLSHIVIAGSGPAAPTLGKGIDFQFIYEHNARSTAAANPDYRYVDLPDEISMASPEKSAYYRDNASVAVPGLGVPQSARTIAVPGAPVRWGITILNNAPNKANAVKFLQLLLSAAGTAALRENGPAPKSPAWVSMEDISKLPEVLRPLVTSGSK